MKEVIPISSLQCSREDEILDIAITEQFSQEVRRDKNTVKMCSLYVWLWIRVRAERKKRLS